MPETSKMSAEEYAAHTGKMSFPAGVLKREQEALERADEVEAAEIGRQACQAQAADYVNRFIRALEDPDMRLVTEKPNAWTNWEAEARAAILAELLELRRLRS